MKGFDGNYKHFNISLKLVAENSSLEIKVVNKETLEHYSQIIDIHYIEEEKDFINIFEEPLEILDFLIHHFNEIAIENETIKFEYIFGNMKKRAKSLSIKLNKQKIEPLELAHLKI
jgi:hypothetical protein